MVTATLRRLDEVHIEVKQMEIMRQCYKDVLGFEENFYHEGKMLGLITGGASLVLTASERRSSGVKLVLSCADIERLVDVLTKRGVTITKPLWEGHWGSRLVGLEDPEGNSIVLQEPSSVNGGHRD